VTPEEVEPEFPGEAHLTLQGFFRRWCGDRSGPVVLVESAEEIHGIPVDRDDALVSAHGSEAERRRPSIVARLELELVQGRPSRMPRDGPGDGGLERRCVGRTTGDVPPIRVEHPVAHGVRPPKHHADPAGGGIGVDPRSVYEVGTAGLDPSALPDPADRAVPALFPVGDLGEGKGAVVLSRSDVEHANRHGVRATGTNRVGHVEREGQVPALVLADLPAVHPDGAEVVDRAEAEPDVAVSPRLVHVEPLLVPGGPGPGAKVLEERLPR
jgi:hypothetical protein